MGNGVPAAYGVPWPISFVAKAQARGYGGIATVMKDSIGTYLKEHRMARRLTQRQLAYLAHVSNTEISRIESGLRKRPTPDTLERIAKILGVPYADMADAAGYVRGAVPVGGEQSQMVLVPILRAVTSGVFLFREDNVVDHELVASELVRDGSQFFFLKATEAVGNRIKPGDLLLVKVQVEIEEGKIAVILVKDQEQALVRRVFLRGNSVFLQSEGSAPPMLVDRQSVDMVGRVMRVQFTVE